jgi:hypothetical protein
MGFLLVVPLLVTNLQEGMNSALAVASIKDDSKEFEKVHSHAHKFVKFLCELDLDNRALLVAMGEGDWAQSSCRRDLKRLISKSHAHLRTFYMADLVRWSGSKACRLLSKALDVALVCAVQACGEENLEIDTVAKCLVSVNGKELEKAWPEINLTNLQKSSCDSWRLTATTILLSDDSFKRIAPAEGGAITLHSGVDESEHSVSLVAIESLLLLPSFIQLFEVILSAQKHLSGKTKKCDFMVVFQGIADFVGGDWQNLGDAFVDFNNMVDLQFGALGPNRDMSIND